MATTSDQLTPEGRAVADGDTEARSALVLSTAIAVGVGDTIARWISPAHLRTAAGLGFLAIGAWILLGKS